MCQRDKVKRVRKKLKNNVNETTNKLENEEGEKVN